MAGAAAPYKTAYDEAEKVLKRQRTCETKVDACLDQLIQHVAKARDALLSGAAQATLAKQLGSQADALFQEASSNTKDLHVAVGKLGKAVDACVDDTVDITKVLKDVQMDRKLLYTVIVEHLYRQGRFQVGNMLLQQAGLEAQRAALAQPFLAVHAVLEQICAGNPAAGLAWAEAQLGYLENQQSGSAAAPHSMPTQSDSATAGQPTITTDVPPTGPTRTSVPHGPRNVKSAIQAIHSFQFRLHSLSFLTALIQQGQAGALQYARSHFAPFSTSHMREIQQLMGCLVYCKRAPTNKTSTTAQQDVTMTDSNLAPTSANNNSNHPSFLNGDANQHQQHAGHANGLWHAACLTLEGSPYAHFMSPSAWQDAGKEFMSLACSLMGLASESPLATVLAAGAAALPRLYKLMSVMTPAVAAEMRASMQLPVELELGPEFVFHPIFACPVSRDQSTPDNPPLLLPCNHVLCEQSVLKIAKSRTRVFKCPYCPVEARADNLRPLVFPSLD